MFERFTDRARRVVVLAQEEARHLNHNYIGTAFPPAIRLRVPRVAQRLRAAWRSTASSTRRATRSG